jgi:putative cell wall-binding protein
MKKMLSLILMLIVCALASPSATAGEPKERS